MKQKMGPLSKSAVSNGLLSIVSLNHFVNDGSSSLIASLFPAMEVAFGLSIYNIGILVAVGYLVSMVLQPMTGYLSEKFHSLKLLPLGISIIATSMILFMFSSDFLSIVVSFLVLRVGASFFHPIGASAISRGYSGPKLDRAMSVESSVGNLGIIFSFLLSAPLYLNLGWKGPFLLYFAIQMGTVILTLTYLKVTASDEEGHVENGRKMAQKDERSFENSDGSGRKYPLGLPAVFIVIGFVTGGSNSVFSNFGNITLFHSGFPYGVANDLIGAFEFVSFVGALITGWLTVRLRRVNLLSISYLVAGVGALAFSFVRQENYSYTVPLLMSGFFLAITYPLTYSELSEFTSKRRSNRGAGYGILFSAQIAGSTAMGYIGGLFSRTIGLSYVFMAVGLLLLIMASMIGLRRDFFRFG